MSGTGGHILPAVEAVQETVPIQTNCLFQRRDELAPNFLHDKMCRASISCYVPAPTGVPPAFLPYPTSVLPRLLLCHEVES